MAIHLYNIYVFPIAALNAFFFFCLYFQYWIKVFVVGCFIGFILFGTFWCVGTQGVISFPHLMEVLNFHLFKNFFKPLPLFPFGVFFWSFPCGYSHGMAFAIVQEFSELSMFFFSFFFFLHPRCILFISSFLPAPN